MPFQYSTSYNLTPAIFGNFVQNNYIQALKKHQTPTAHKSFNYGNATSVPKKPFFVTLKISVILSSTQGCHTVTISRMESSVLKG
jgi:hypothetical protein